MQSAWERINNLYANEDDLDEKLMSDVYDKGLSLGFLLVIQKACCLNVVCGSS